MCKLIQYSLPIELLIFEKRHNSHTPKLFRHVYKSVLPVSEGFVLYV